MASAKDYIMNGGDIKAIETKYKLTTANKKELNEIEKQYSQKA